jgi:phage gpG-like protein
MRTTKRAGVTLNWFGDEVAKEFRAKIAKQVRLAAELVKSHIMRNVGTSNLKGKNPSKPGEYPHAGSGNFRASIFVTMDEEKLEAQIGSDMPYAAVLEFGSPGGKIVHAKGSVLRWIGPDGRPRFAKFIRLGKIEARAPFRRGMLEMQGRVQALLTTFVN